MRTIYVCKDSLEGIFSAVYDAWKAKETEESCGIGIRGSVEQQLFCEYVEVSETSAKAAAVERMIAKNLGGQAHHDLVYATLSAAPDKGDAVLGAMLAAKKLPDSRRMMEHLSHPKVERVFELSRTVANEAHATLEFLRFRELENGVLYAPVTPRCQVLSCIAPHFADRFPLENWMIHDKTHHVLAVHERKKQWILVQEELAQREAVQSSKSAESHAEEGTAQDWFGNFSEAEREYAVLWKSFCNTIAIPERKNPVCQRGHLPLRYRPDMTEFQTNR